MKTSKIDLAIFDCYRELFAQATPPADFDKLVEQAEVNERGQKIIPFMDHEISEQRCLEIISAILTKHKVPKRLHQSFHSTIYLGCSPRFPKQ